MIISIIPKNIKNEWKKENRTSKKTPKKQNKTKETKTNKHYAQQLELNIILFRFPKPTLWSFIQMAFKTRRNKVFVVVVIVVVAE